jgi:RimJ/RimL family protein N-acetyltransferase
MTLEGTIREGQFTDGRFWDICIFGMTADEFFARYGSSWGDLAQ